jgi:FkbM family methyltransferase
MARTIGKKGKVFAFEPHPKSFALLKKNIEINGYKNVILVQRAASDKIGKEKLYYRKSGHPTDGSIFPSRKDCSFVEIETVKLSDFIKERIDFIKMDIEGAEGANNSRHTPDFSEQTLKNSF